MQLHDLIYSRLTDDYQVFIYGLDWHHRGELQKGEGTKGKHQRGVAWDGTADPVLRDQILRHERCPFDHKVNSKPYEPCADNAQFESVDQ